MLDFSVFLMCLTVRALHCKCRSYLEVLIVYKNSVETVLRAMKGEVDLLMNSIYFVATESVMRNVYN